MATQREKAFLEDLDALLKKHRAKLNITDDGKPWGLHSAVLNIELEGYEVDGECVSDEEFNY